MTKTERAAQIERFCSNDDNFEFVSREEYEASAQGQASRRYHAAKAKRVAVNEAADLARATSFTVGQSVKVRNKVVFGTITAIDGNRATITVTASQFVRMPVGATPTFATSFVQAA